MTHSRCWIIASISFLVSMIFSLGAIAFSGITGVVFTVLTLAAVVAGWILWIVGFVAYFLWR